jgi:hypothetical protein
MWLIIAGGLIILFGYGGVIQVECIKCARVWTWLVGVISVALGIGALATANRAMPGR